MTPAQIPSTQGLTLIELIIVVAVITILASAGIPIYSSAVESARVAKAIGDLRVIAQAVDQYALSYGEYPPSLAAVAFHREDPWGVPYVYWPFTGTDLSPTTRAVWPWAGRAGKNSGADQRNMPQPISRKNRTLTPINTYYDLYSLGADRGTQTPLTAGPSRDDVVRANDGGYFGLVSQY